jgi:type I restriction enzyme S subunit
MNREWPIVRLGEVLKATERGESVDPTKTYRLLGVRLDGFGPFLRETVTGVQTSASKLFRVAKGDFIYSRLFACRGAFGVVSKELDGCFVSGEFPTFVPVSEKIDVNYLKYWFHIPTVIASVDADCTGSTPLTRNRFKENFFLALEIPLPPISEQRRIVRRIEEMESKLKEARRLREMAFVESQALHLSVLHQHFVIEAMSWIPMPMVEAIEINDKQVDPTLPEYANLPHISGENIESKTCRLLPWRSAEADGIRSSNYLFSPGAILYSKIRPYLRKAAFVDFRGVCSADIYPIRVKSPKLDPQFVKWALVADPFTDYANRLSGRTRMPKLNRNQLFGFDFLHPSLPEQHRIVSELDALQAEVDTLKRLQEETSKELDALLPSILDKAFKGEL